MPGELRLRGTAWISKRAEMGFLPRAFKQPGHKRG